MRNTAIFIGMLIILIVLLTFVYNKSTIQDRSLTVYENIPSPKAQEIDKRLWKNTIVQSIHTIKEFGDSTIIMASRIEISDDGILYIMDFPRKIIAQFSPNGKFIRTIGKGEGDGPGEFRQPVDFTIRSNGYLSVTDASQKSVTIFNPAGEIVDFTRLYEIPHRITANDSVYMIMRAGIGEYFYFYNHNWDIINKTGIFLKEQKDLPILLDILLQQYNGSFFAAFNQAGYIVCYDSTGNLNYYRKTIDDIPFPEVHIRTIGESLRMSLANDATRVHQDMNITNGNIYILSAYASQQLDDKYVIDVYKAHNGDYIYSFTFPKNEDTYGIMSAKVWNSLLATTEILNDGSSVVRLYQISR